MPIRDFKIVRQRQRQRLPEELDFEGVNLHNSDVATWPRERKNSRFGVVAFT